MRVVLQRVSRASVTIDGNEVGAIGLGVVALVGVAADDGDEEARWLAHKTAQLRIFDDPSSGPERSLLDVGGEALVVSQFTLLGDTRRGLRPSWSAAAPAPVAEPLVRTNADVLAQLGLTVAQGRFGASMQIELVNDGPLTIVLERTSNTA